MNFCRLSRGGGESVPSSAVVPNALPALVVSHQRLGGSQTYGPSIFIPAFAFAQVATLSSVGFCQCRPVAIDLYCERCVELTGWSLPNAHRKALACARRFRIWLSSEAWATFSCSVDHVSFSQALQQTNPPMRMTPFWSARSYRLSLPTVPSKRMAFSPMSLRSEERRVGKERG